jgi:hypothetical protein
MWSSSKWKGGGESIESFIEDQAFSLSFGLAPPPPPPPSPGSFLSFSFLLCVSLVELTVKREGGGGGVGAKSEPINILHPSNLLVYTVMSTKRYAFFPLCVLK